MGELARYKVGQVLRLGDGRVGTVRWLGTGEFAEGEFLGLELDDASGKNNGEVKGVKYFDCPDNHGLMVRPSSVETILESPTAPVPKTTTTAAKRMSLAGASSNGTKGSTTAVKRTSMAGVSAGRKPTLTDPTSKRQSINAASPTPAVRGTASRALPSPTKAAAGRPLSILGPPKPAAASMRPVAAASTAARRTSLAGRAPLVGGPPATRTTRTPSLASTSSSAKPPPAGTIKKPIHRLSTMQQPATRRTASISSRKGLNEPGSEEQGDDDEQSMSQGEAEGVTDSSTRKPQSAGRTLLSPPAPGREPISPNLSRPTTQQLSAQNRKIDDLETKLRVLEKQKTEDKERLKDMERLSGERDKFEGIIQKLQSKIQPQSQELVQLRKELKETTERATTAESAQASVDEIIEEAALDREMAEELAETYKSELDLIRKSHEELKLEVEILRAENEDLGREMSPEERDSMGFAQLEKSNERLREALIKLRDITQDTEAELKGQVKELQDETQEFSGLKIKFDESQEQLEQNDSFIDELKQQLETAQGSEEMIEELTEKNMALSEQIEELKGVVEDLESLKEINDELEVNHVEHEKAMQEDIDYRDALLFEQARKMSEQDEIVEELEYTVSRFRELVANLNSDLEDMRSSQQITEAEANDLSNRTKTMLDLNMRLQQTAAKTQIRVIDTELKRLEAQEASDHLAIVEMFLPDSFAKHKDSVSTFLRFKRISFKAMMLHGIIKEKVNGLAVPGHEDDMFADCDILDRLTWIAAMCNRFVKFITSCSLDVFSSIGTATYDLDPVERMFNGFVENLKRDELKDQKCAADLARTMSVLEHLGERYLGQGLADYAEAVHMRALVMQSHLDSGASAVAHIRSIAQARVVLPTDADEIDEEEAQNFLAKADTVVTQIRSAKVIANKALHQLEELQSRSLTLEPSTQASIEATELAVRTLATSCRVSGVSVAKLVNQDSRLDSLKFEEVMQAVSPEDSTPFATLTSAVSSVIAAVQTFSTLTTTLSQTVEFAMPQTNSLSAASTPWAQLALFLREESSASAGHEAEIARLNDQLNERGTAIALKDKALDELSVSVEVLEKRTSDANKAVTRARELEQQLHQAERKGRDLDSRLQRSVEDVRLLRMERESWLASGAAKSGTDEAGEQGPEAARAPVHADFVSAKAVSEIAVLKAELEVTQNVVRQLRAASNEANLSAAQADGILESLLTEPQKGVEEQQACLREASAKRAFKTLRTLATREETSLVKLRAASRNERLRWAPLKESAAWQVERARDEWDSWRNLVGVVAKDELSASKRRELTITSHREKEQSAADNTTSSEGRVLAKLTLRGLPQVQAKPFDGHITIINGDDWDGLGRRLGMVY